MAHFAKLNAENFVEQIIVVNNEVLRDENGHESEVLGIAFCKSLYGEDTHWIQTSYNTKDGVHYAPHSHFTEPDDGVALRWDYASGKRYDPVTNKFVFREYVVTEAKPNDPTSTITH